MKTVSRTRDASIDILRGIATVLVVIGHIPYTPTALRAWIYTFHVPLFFVCSGILFSIERYPKFKDLFFARVKGLLLPILSLGILARLLQVLISWIIGTASGAGADYRIALEPGKLLLSLLLGYRVHDYYYSFWFLYALFLGEILFYFAVKLFRKRWYCYLLMILCGIALQYWISTFACGFIWSVDLLPAGLAFLAAGHLYRILLYEKERKLPAWLFPVMLAVNILFTCLNYKNGEQVNLFYDYIGNPAFYLIAAAAGCLMCILFADLIRKSRLLEFFGRNSLVTYGFQNTVFIPLMIELLRFAGYGSSLFEDNTLKWILTVTGTLLLSALLSGAINRFAPFLLGKRRKGKNA